MTPFVGGEWCVEVQTGLVATPAWPFVFPAGALVLGVAAAGAWIAAAFREGRGRPALAPFAVVLAFAASALVSVFPHAFIPTTDATTTVQGVFGDGLEAAVSVASFVLLGLGFTSAAWVASPRLASGVWAGTAAALSAAAGLGAGATAVWTAWLYSIGAIPELSPTIPARIHVGLAVEAVVEAPAPWSAAPLQLRADRAGSLPWRAEAHRPGLRVVTTGEVEAGDDRPSALFPLAVGNRWRLGRTTSWHDQYLWFISSDHSVPGEGPTLMVRNEAIEGGLHVWTVDRTEPDGQTLSWQLYGWNGVTRTLPDHAVFVEANGSRMEVAPGTWVTPCTFGALPYTCTCYTDPPGGPVTLAGPARCVGSTGGGVVSDLVSALIGIVTVGLVLEDPSREVVLELTESGH